MLARSAKMVLSALGLQVVNHQSRTRSLEVPALRLGPPLLVRHLNPGSPARFFGEQGDVFEHIHICIYICISYVYIHTHTCIHSYMHTYMEADDVYRYTHTYAPYVGTYIHKHTCIYMDTYTYTYTYTCTYTYTYTYTCMYI